MLSESARMSSAAEAAFRIQAPNSRTRATNVVALDRASEHVVTRLAESLWNQAAFFTAVDWDPDEASRADQVVMLAAPGGDAQLASKICEACSRRRVMTTALVIGASSASEAALSKTLAQLRPWAMMVVIATNDEYVDDMLHALRA